MIKIDKSLRAMLVKSYISDATGELYALGPLSPEGCEHVNNALYRR